MAQTDCEYALKHNITLSSLSKKSLTRSQRLRREVHISFYRVSKHSVGAHQPDNTSAFKEWHVLGPRQ